MDSVNSILITKWASSEEFSRRPVSDGSFCYFSATAISLLLLLLFHFFLTSKSRFFSLPSSSSPAASVSLAVNSQSRTSRLVSDEDLKCLIDNLEERNETAEIWENVIHKSNHRISYTAKRCKPSVDSNTGIEIGRTIKKFPLLTSREYLLAWRLWEGKDKFYCFTKECDHNLVLQQRKYVRVSYFRSGWRIKKVPGRNACEVKMFHQENAGLNVEMAKLAFSKGIWSYVCKMENALRKYIATSRRLQEANLSAVSLIKKVPSELENDVTASMGTTSDEGVSAHVAKQKKLLRKPSKKVIAKGLVLVGGAICLSRGHSALGAKVALAYLLTKLNKRPTPLNQTTQKTSI